MFFAISMIIVFLAGLVIGRWLYPSETAVERMREERERGLECPDYERARLKAEVESELFRWKR